MDQIGPGPTGMDKGSQLVIVIGRGHSGTRAISHTLTASGVFMGEPLNRSGDLVPAEKMYEACRVAGRRVRYLGDWRWDFSGLLAGPADAEFGRLTDEYLASVRASGAPRRGWKLPETTLVYPWICHRFPDAYYIFWVRDPRDAILGRHLTDDLADFGIPYPATADDRERRAISWLYQAEIFGATPRPRHLIEVRFEDFVLRQEETLDRLGEFLGFPLARLPVRADRIGQWRAADGPVTFPFLGPAMVRFGYGVEDGNANA